MENAEIGEVAIIKNEKAEMATTESQSLLRLAIEKNLDVEKLEKLISLKVDEEKRQAEKEFNFRFAEMQKDYIPAIKSKSVSTSSGKVAYSYCPLPEILAVYSPILSKHGFSYYWEETELKESEKTITCFLSGFGHTRTASISLPYMIPGQMTNIIQARGATSEYGRRYTFMNVTGCIVADGTDTDWRIQENKNGAEEIKKAITKTLPLIPVKMRNQYILQMGKAKLTEEFENVLKNVLAMKARCKKLAEDATKKGLRDELATAWKSISTEDEIMDWEAKIESL